MIQEIYGASPQTFSLLFGVNSVGLVVVGQINGKVLVGRVSLDRVAGRGPADRDRRGRDRAAADGDGRLRRGRAWRPVAAALFVLMSAMGLALPNTNASP